ncbi:MAG: RAMP superfamily CRISPR-associated protein [Candidatus Methanofastidiosia archaeon]
MNNLSMRITFTLDSPLHITGDQVHRGVNKSAYIQELLEDEICVIPATTVKGVLRSRLEYLLRGLGKKCCTDQSCGHCFVCRIFGHPRKESPLMFQDASCDGTIRIRPGVRINRKRKVALDKHLFSIEIVEANTFRTEIRGFFESHGDALEACAALWTAAKSCEGFGAGRSHGLGWSCLNTFDARIDGKTVAPEVIEKKAREVFQ